MKVLAGLVTQGSGSIGGMTMSKNKQGYYLRARTVPSNPNTLSQQAIRTAFAALTPAWSSLTQSQQANWNLYAKNVSVVLNNGQTRILSGFNWFVGANQLRLQANEDVQNDAPSVMTMAQSPYGIEAFYTGMNTMAVRFNLLDAPTTPGTGDQLLIQIGRPQTLGTLYFKSPYQFVGTIDSFDAGSYVTLDVTNFSAYEAAYNQSQWMRITRILPDGRYSTPTTYGPYRGFGAPDVYGFGASPLPSISVVNATSVVVPHTIGNITDVNVIQAGSDALGFNVAGNVLTIVSAGGVNTAVTSIIEVTGDLGDEVLVLPISLQTTPVFENNPWSWSGENGDSFINNYSNADIVSISGNGLPDMVLLELHEEGKYLLMQDLGITPGVYNCGLDWVTASGATGTLPLTITAA
jgi:hypothetical protein